MLEETLLQQTHIQYGLNVSCLRAPWIMEKDDFRYSLSFGDDVFGGPDWKTLVPPEVAERCRKEGTIPLLRDAHGRPLKRNFVHVDDLVDAILAALDNPATRGKLYNIAMDEPVDYAAVAAHLKTTQGLGSIDIPSAYHAQYVRRMSTTGPTESRRASTPPDLSARPRRPGSWCGRRQYPLGHDCLTPLGS